MTGSWFRTVLLVTALAMSFSLASCNKQRREKEAAAFGQTCGQAGFGPKQCAFLYAMRQDARNRADESDAVAIAGMNAAASVAIINGARR